MKKILIFLIVVMFLFTGCMNQTANEEQKISKENKNDESLLKKEFNKLKNEKNETEMFEFLNVNYNDISKDALRNMVLDLEKIQEKNLEVYSKNLESDDNNESKLRELRKKGFKIILEEGIEFPIIDYSKYKKFSRGLPDITKDYIEILSIESKENSISDASLLISWDEVLNRALKCEEFLEKFKNQEKFPEYEVVKINFLEYVGNYIYGANNTPSFNYDDELLDSELKLSYQGFIKSKEDENSMLKQEIKSYYNILEKNNFKSSEKIQETMDEIFQKFNQKYNINNQIQSN